ncbi:MAG: LysR family transcriptional regulator [Bacteroidales bacterium]|jgi:molybdate transport system regulatory protein|nr:LysR family transcriptional regulator [Bacteroidales bacterium]HOL99102.1 LysR family transcriptional regulator [Bacteroidales bacterium]HPD24495.1 LysR family transcriptional regulator [Bacteroidales bacterium]HRT00101.1 LysR family transcriptional regulator [Bacteroidales bacterium]HUM33567.1 LysR family transcriptional regulator [Bacteroidales bacterium]
MAGKKGSKYYNIFMAYKICLNDVNKNELINESSLELLKNIYNQKSLVAAAKESNITFRTAWNKIHTMEKHLGFKLIISERGGENGGLSYLTDDGLNLLNAYLELRTKIDNSLKNITKKFFNTINI